MQKAKKKIFEKIYEFFGSVTLALSVVRGKCETKMAIEGLIGWDSE